MEPKPKRISRALYAWEIAEAQTIFGGSLAFERVRIQEGVTWPDLANIIGSRLKGLPAPGPESHNAVTIGYTCNFPINLPQTLPAVGAANEYFVDWLMHEMTHAWQYQHTGVTYIFKALSAQFTLKDKAYDFGGPDNLNRVRAAGGNLFSFNPEAQAVIAQTYYYWKRHNRDVSAYEPYIDDIRKAK